MLSFMRTLSQRNVPASTYMGLDRNNHSILLRLQLFWSSTGRFGKQYQRYLPDNMYNRHRCTYLHLRWAGQRYRDFHITGDHLQS